VTLGTYAFASLVLDPDGALNASFSRLCRESGDICDIRNSALPRQGYVPLRPLTDILISATHKKMAKTPDPNRFHRIVGWVFATGFLMLIGLPVLLTSTMGECLPHDHLGVSDCLANKRIEFFALIFGLPVLATLVGWLTYRWSRFLG